MKLNTAASLKTLKKTPTLSLATIFSCEDDGRTLPV